MLSYHKYWRWVGKVVGATRRVARSPNPQRDLARDAREQPWWDEHAAFSDGLVAEGFIQFGGPLDEEGGGFLVVMARDEVEAREWLRHDPWYAHGILSLVSLKRWRIFIDTWEARRGA